MPKDRFLKLVVDMGFEWVAEVQVVRHGRGKRSDAHEIPGRLGNGAQYPHPRIQVNVATVYNRSSRPRPCESPRRRTTPASPPGRMAVPVRTVVSYWL